MRIEVLVDGRWDPRHLDESTRHLAQDLRHIGGIAVDPLTGPAPEGGKSTTVPQIGALVVSGVLSAAGLKAIGDVLVAYLNRSGARKITLRNGDREITIEGASAADVRDVVGDIDRLLLPPDPDRKSLE